MIKFSGKAKRILVVGTTLLISCISGYGLIDWIWLGNGIYDGVTGTQEKLAIILLPFLALFWAWIIGSNQKVKEYQNLVFFLVYIIL